MLYEVEINGVTYESKPELAPYSCSSCVAEGNISLCNELDKKDHPCYNIVWIKKEKPMETVKQTDEPKYTVEEVLLSLEYLNYYNPTDAEADNLKQYLEKQRNPDYKLYLELKAKFGE